MSFLQLTLTSILIFMSGYAIANNRRFYERNTKLKNLQRQIVDLELYHDRLLKEVDYTKYKKTSPNIPETDVTIDIYRDSNIELPLNIIEELNYAKLDVEETIKFAEHLRQHWKLENTKKLYRKK